MNDAIQSPLAPLATETAETREHRLNGRRVTAAETWRSNRRSPIAFSLIDPPGETIAKGLTISDVGLRSSANAPSPANYRSTTKDRYDA